MTPTISRGAFGALLIAHCAGMIDLISLPVWVGALVSHYHFTPQLSGQLITLFLAGAVLSSLATAALLKRLPRRAMAAVGFGAAALCFALAAQTTDYLLLSVLHLGAGLASGLGLSLVHGAMGASANPHRIFASAGIALGGTATVFLAVLPTLVLQHGGAIIFQVIAGIMAVAAVAMMIFYPTLPQPAVTAARPRARMSRQVWLVILGISLMTLNNVSVFSFLEVIGKSRLFADERIVHVFIAMGLINFLVVAPLSLLLEKRVPGRRAVLVGPALQILLALVITNATSFAPWAVAAALFTGVQIMTHTFAFGLLARIEPTGRAVAATPAMLMSGAAIGPFLSGTIGQAFGFGALAVSTTIIGLLAIAAFWLSSQARAAAPAPAAAPSQH